MGLFAWIEMYASADENRTRRHFMETEFELLNSHPMLHPGGDLSWMLHNRAACPYLGDDEFSGPHDGCRT